MGQKQRKGAEIKGKPPMTAVQSDNSKAPENAIGEVMEHSQKNAEPRTGALRMEPHEREEQILKIAAEHFTRRGVLGASMSAKPTQASKRSASTTKTPRKHSAGRCAPTSSS